MIGEKHKGSDIQNGKTVCGKNISDREWKIRIPGTVTSPLGIFSAEIFLYEGQKIEEKIYPGYVIVDMVLDNDSWYVVRNTPRVTGFVGADSATPTPLSKEEIDFLINKMGEAEPKFKVDLKEGDLVRITDGPFKEQEGKISEVDSDHGRVKVLVPIFGRDTLVELDSLQVHKV
jgi:transcriptional antiterminator NusG